MQSKTFYSYFKTRLSYKITTRPGLEGYDIKGPSPGEYSRSNRKLNLFQVTQLDSVMYQGQIERSEGKTWGRHESRLVG